MSTAEQAEGSQERLKDLLGSQNELVGAVVASEDGHVLAESSRKEMPGDRIAAMSSSLVGLGGTMAETVAQGGNQFVIVQNDEGYVATLRIDSRHLLTVVAKAGINLGMLLSLSRTAAEGLATTLNG